MTTDLFTTNSTENDWLLRGTLLSGRSDVAGITPGRFGGVKSTPGAPASGTWQTGTFIFDSLGVQYYCTVGGTSGTWVSIGTGAPGTLSDSQQNVIATGQATTSAAYTDLGTVGPVVTLTVPASGKVFCTIACSMGASAVNGDGQMGVALSGANTAAADNANALYLVPPAANTTMQMGTSFMLTGLTPGSTVFTCKYKAPSGVSFSFGQRKLVVMGLA